jgi:Family of unknown function (DUF6299)
MKAIFRLMTVLVLVLGALGASASPAQAAAPSNDTFGSATLVTVGFSEVINTTEATTDADDAQLNASCGAPATDASVWYVLSGTDTGIIVDVSQSDYSAGVLVGVGTQGNLTTVACGPGAVAFFAAAGETYYLLAIDDQLNGDGLNGGQLSISFTEIPPPPTLDITVNPYGKFNSKTGTATISGKYTCTNGDFIQVDVSARQNVGRFYILGSGSFGDFGTCDGTAHSWSAEIFPQNGIFKGGKTISVTFAVSCGPFECGFGFVEQKVLLRGK